jgi:hypothetical protein
MVKKCVIVAVFTTAIVSMSELAHAGATISDKRYWPSEARPPSQTAARQPKDAFGAEIPPSKAAPVGRRYYGGPNPSPEDMGGRR